MTTTTFTSNTSGGVGGCSTQQIDESTPTTVNPETAGVVEMNNFAAGDTGRTLIRFTGVAAAIPPGSTITAVKGRVALDFSTNSAPAFEVGWFKMLRAWVKSQSTWNIFSTGNNWQTAGASGASDRSASASVSLVIGDTSASGNPYLEWLTTSQFVADVQAAVDAGVDPTWIMQRTDATSTATRGWGGGTYSDTFRPQLVVDWTASQVSHPTSDVSSGVWVPSTGASLFGTIDETTADDADYDYVTLAAGSTFEVALGALTDPASSSSHVVHYRIAAASGQMTVSLRQGASTQIASWNHNPAPTTPTTFNQTLSGGEADSITDYTDLRLRFVAAP